MAKRNTTTTKKKKTGGSHRRKSPGRALVVAPRAEIVERHYGGRGIPVIHQAKQASRRRRKHQTPPVSMEHVGITGLILGAVAGTKSTPIIGDTVYNLALKVPGAKTFGGPAAVGGVIWGASALLNVRGKARTWANAAGLISLGIVALKVGQEQTGLKWLGDSGSDMFARGARDAIRDITGH